MPSPPRVLHELQNPKQRSHEDFLPKHREATRIRDEHYKEKSC